MKKFETGKSVSQLSRPDGRLEKSITQSKRSGFLFGLSSKTLFDFSVIDTKKLVCTSSHVDVIGFPLRAFFVQKTIDRIVNWLCLEKAGHDEKERFPETGRATFRSIIAAAFKLAGFIYAGIYAGKSRESLPMIEAGNISDLGNQLRSEGNSNTTHGHDGAVFR